MGLEINSYPIYLTISNGKICRQYAAKTETSVERINKNGKLVHEEFYDRISGTITGIKTRLVKIAGQEVKFWELKIEDDTETFVLQLKYSSGYANGFLKSIPNAAITKRLTLVPFCKEEDGKKKTTVFIYQDNVALKHYFTRENPNGLPRLIKTKFKGKEMWDDNDIMQFFENMIEIKIKPQLKTTRPIAGMAETVNAEGTAGNISVL